MERLAAHPHHVGSPYDKDNADWIAAKFKEFGLDTHIEQFDVLYPTPKERVVELVEGGPKFVAKLQEPVVKQDPTSNQTSEQLPTYHVYSKDGDVTAPLVYVNYGVPEDYEQLDRMGVSVKGAIVIARYYHSWRGIKPKVAAEHGAVGCLIYSDPHEDGFVEGEVFPEGAWRPKDGAQRGSVADMPFYAGDPLTPGVGATKDAKRLKVEDSPTITKIPVLPISYADAQPLLAALTGRVAPEGWRGGLAITYRVGPGPAKVHLKVKSNWEPLKPVYDVIAKIPGSTNPDEWVIRGNHHDAWVNGAEDPTSGMVAVLEEARAFGELLKQGWKPKRTIILAAWDGEEPGLLGSTEWAEATRRRTNHARRRLHQLRRQRPRLFRRRRLAHAGKIHQRSFAATSSTPKPSSPPGSATSSTKSPKRKLPKPARKSAIAPTSAFPRSVPAPTSPASSSTTASPRSTSASAAKTAAASTTPSTTTSTGTRISATPTFVYGRALAQAGGSATMRLADADLLPFEFNNFADTVQTYAKELKDLAKKMRDDIIERNREIDEGVFTATNDPKKPLVAPPAEIVPPYLNFAPFDNAVDQLNHAAADYKKALDHANADGGTCARLRLARRSKSPPDRKRAQTHHARRPAQSPLVQAPALRPRLLHRLRRQNRSRRP